jgi:hypothetical protein
MSTRARVVEYDNSAAALDLSAGKVAGRRHNRRRRVEFLDFMNKIAADDLGREIQWSPTIRRLTTPCAT